MRKALHEWLEIRFPGCHVIEATSGVEAIVLAQVSSPHVVIMDIDLLGMSGLQATARIKAMVLARQLVILSFHDDKAHRAHATVAGANAYVVKGRISTEFQPILAALLPPSNRLNGSNIRHLEGNH